MACLISDAVGAPSEPSEPRHSRLSTCCRPSSAHTILSSRPLRTVAAFGRSSLPSPAPPERARARHRRGHTPARSSIRQPHLSTNRNSRSSRSPPHAKTARPRERAGAHAASRASPSQMPGVEYRQPARHPEASAGWRVHPPEHRSSDNDGLLRLRYYRETPVRASGR